MFHHSKKLQSCIEAILLIAVKSGGHPINSKELCRLQGEKERYLEPIMQCLVHNNILRSIRGPKGGYVLMRERRKVTLAEIAAILQEQDKIPLHEKPPSLVKQQIIAPLYQELDNLLMARLKEITLEDICKQAESCDGFTINNKEDFII